MKRKRTVKELKKEIAYLENRWNDYEKMSHSPHQEICDRMRIQMYSIERQIDWLYAEVENRLEKL